MKITIERYDKDCHRLKDEAGTIIGFALRLANNKWCLTDPNDKKITPISFDTPAQVRDAMQQRLDYVDAVNNTTEEDRNEPIRKLRIKKIRRLL